MRTKKLKKGEMKVSLMEEINLQYEGYGNLSKKTRRLCALYNRELKKVWRLRLKVIRFMMKDYYRQIDYTDKLRNTKGDDKG